jgi:hypothetical protein
MMYLSGLVASTSSSSDHKKVVFTLAVDKVGIAFGVLIALALLAVLIGRRERQPEPGPRTLETPPQSPAVAGLLVHTREVPGEVAAATLVDLAARGFLETIEMGGGTPGVRLTRKAGQDLAPYEQRIVALVRTHADAQALRRRPLSR